MNIKEFTEEIATMLGQKLQYDGYEVQMKEVNKNNQTTKFAVLLMKEDEHVYPAIYLDQYYQAFQNDTYQLEEIVDEIYSSVEYFESQSSYYNELDLSFDQCKDRIVYRLVSAALNEKGLDQIPTIPFLDFFICFYLVISLDGENISSTKITNAMMESWQMKVSELYNLAKENTQRLFPLELKHLANVLKEHYEIELDSDEMKRAEFYVLTNEKGLFGATSLLYEDVIADFAEEMQDDIYLLPSSVHEFLLLPQQGMENKTFFDDMVKEVNSSCVDQEEVLSDHAYLYKREEKKFVL